MVAAGIQAQSQWVKQSDFPGGGVASQISFTIGNNVYCGLGENNSGLLSTMYQYNGTSKQWQSLGNFPGTLRTQAVSFSIGNYGYVGLGITASYTRLKDFYRYDPANDTWTSVADFPGAARCGAVAFVINGKAYVGTGQGNSHYKDMYEYDPVANSWLQVANYPYELANAVAFAIDGKGYICSGCETSFIYNGVDMYNPTTNTWTQKIFSDGKLSNRHYGTAFVLDGKGFICGGNMTAASVITYNPSTNKVENYNSYGVSSDKMSYPSSFVIGNKAFVTGGRYWTGDLWTGTYVYNPQVWALTVGTSTIVNDIASTSVKVFNNQSEATYHIKGLQALNAWQLMNIHGQTVLSGQTTDDELLINMSSQSQGIYILQLGQTSFKLIKK
jgi:N-acetylneuraminic acid mutarotase